MKEKPLNIYAIPMLMYVEVFYDELATGLGELNAFALTEALRKLQSGWTEDEESIITANGTPYKVESFPTESYNRETLVRVYGEDRAIRFLNHSVNQIHP